MPADKRVILIAGPTASGKSNLALALAEKRDGVIINADSMQVYRELRVLSARPSQEDEAHVSHELYGFVSGSAAYSAGRYAVDAKAAIAEARLAGKTPIIVGGTGLYFKVLLEGLSPVPEVDPDARAYWREQAAQRPSAELHALLALRDPDAAKRVMPTDPQRIVRALEVFESTGRPLSEWQRMPGDPVLAEADTVRLAVFPDRDTMVHAIDNRFDAMLDDGAVDEVRGLLALGLSWELPIMRALGVAPLAAFVEGRMSRESAAAQAKAETRQYAKRQLTWLRRNMISWKHINTQQMESKSALDLTFIDS